MMPYGLLANVLAGVWARKDQYMVQQESRTLWLFFERKQRHLLLERLRTSPGSRGD